MAEPMTETDLRSHVRRHNILQAVSAIAMVFGAVVMWPISFNLLKFLVRMPLELAEIQNALTIATCIAWIGIAFLMVEGLRYWRLVAADREDSDNSDFDDLTGMSQGSAGMNVAFGNVGAAYFLTFMILAAPRLTAQALFIPRLFIRTTSVAYAQGATIYNQLAHDRKWTPVSEWPNHRAGVFLLDRLRLIWTRLNNDEMQIRIPPGDGLPAGS